VVVQILAGIALLWAPCGEREFNFGYGWYSCPCCKRRKRRVRYKEGYKEG